MSAGPRFRDFEAVPVTNHVTGAVRRLVRADRVDCTVAWCARVASICNEPRVYGLLFRERLGGAPYPPEDAEHFAAWGREGWAAVTHFLFLVEDDDRLPLAALDVKSTDLASAEIGYWCAGAERGVMTNAVAAMVGLAREAGYRGLHAFVVPSNGRSIGVLERNGFAYVGLGTSRGKSCLRYELAL